MPIREEVTYPKLKPLPGSNPCAGNCSSFEHILACGHSVNTPEPDEVCGSNCWAVARAPAMSPEKWTAGEPFWCDACIEEKIEADVETMGNITAQQAEDLRIVLRTYHQIENHEALTQARKTYIGEKRVTLPVNQDNELPRGYQAPNPKHPFEVGTLHAGRSFFEDVDPNPVSSIRGAPLAAASSMVPQRDGNMLHPQSASSIVLGGRHPPLGTQSLWATQDRFHRRRVLNVDAAPGAAFQQQPMPQITFRANSGARNTPLRMNTPVVDLVDEDEITEIEAYPTQARLSKKQQDFLTSRKDPPRRAKATWQAGPEEDVKDKAENEAEDEVEGENGHESAPTGLLQHPRPIRTANAAAFLELSPIAPSFVARPLSRDTAPRGQANHQRHP